MNSRRLAIYLLSSMMASESIADDLFPFTEGVLYTYEFQTHQLNGVYSTYFYGTAEIGGQTVRVRHFTGNGHDGLLEYWSEAADGDKLYHGAQWDNAFVSFVPPILMIDEPLFVGKTWMVVAQASDGLMVQIHFEVTDLAEVTVPAGSYQAFTVVDTWEYPPPETRPRPAGTIYADFRATAAITGTTQRMTRRTYANGVGQLLWAEPSRTDRLLSVRTVSVMPTTWSGIRMLYR